VANTTLSKLVFAGLLLGAGAAQAAGPVSVSEVPGSWYADRIHSTTPITGAQQPLFPSAAYEHGTIVPADVSVRSARPKPSVAGATSPFPSSPNESGSVL
jgi:hypothetical protein